MGVKLKKLRMVFHNMKAGIYAFHKNIRRAAGLKSRKIAVYFLRGDKAASGLDMEERCLCNGRKGFMDALDHDIRPPHPGRFSGKRKKNAYGNRGASSTKRGTPRLWQIREMEEMSLTTPSYVGEVMTTRRISGWVI